MCFSVCPGWMLSAKAVSAIRISVKYVIFVLIVSADALYYGAFLYLCKSMAYVSACAAGVE